MNLYKIIKQNQKLAEKRNPAFDTNRFAKFLIYFMIVYWAALFLFLGVSHRIRRSAYNEARSE